MRVEHRKQMETFFVEQLQHAYRIAYTYTGNPYDAEDVVYESIAKALSKADTLREPGMMQSWFFRIVSNTALSQLRGRKRMQPMEDQTMHALLGGAEDPDDLAFDAILRPLAPDDRTLLTLRYRYDMPLADIAQYLSLSTNTVKSRLYRALRKLRTTLGQEASG